MQAIIVSNGSITLPPEALVSLDLKDGDEVLVWSQNNKLIISTQILDKPRKKIASIVGIAKGVFRSDKDIDSFMKNERNSWS
jgi:antitoxin component of MazEF toxin-antitoxin module